MSTAPGLGLRGIIGLLALTGLAGVLPLSLAEWTTGSACPHLGPVPACYLVSVAYAAMLITVLDRRFWRVWYFWAGWAPVFMLAATGTALEILDYGTCPRTGSDTPLCFLSLGLSVALVVPVTVHLFASSPEGLRK